MKLLFCPIIIVVCFQYSSSLPVTTVVSIDNDNLNQQTVTIDNVEIAAKLLITLDDAIEKAFQSEPVMDHFYLNQAEPAADKADTNLAKEQREEKFSIVLQDLEKIEAHIKEAIAKANSNRQFRLVMRLRPLLSYVNHIHRNMEMLRTRVVAIATLSNLTFTVNDVLDQFGDVMTSSTGLASFVPNKERRPAAAAAASPPAGLLPMSPPVRAPTRPEYVPPPTTTTATSKRPTTSLETTLSYSEVDSENFFKNIILQTSK